MRTYAWLLAPLAACTLGGCAGTAEPPIEIGGPGAAAEMNLFISPFGKPYRGAPGQPYPSAVWFSEADKDHDGRLSRAEFRADGDAFFAQLDTDHDGVVDGFETAAYEQGLPEIQPRVRGLRAGEGMDLGLGRSSGAPPLQLDQGRPTRRGGARGRQGAGLFTFLDQPQPVKIADTDFDSKITSTEEHAASDRRFAILDLDQDGFITLAELPKTPVQAFAERQGAAERRSPRRTVVERGTGAPARPNP